MKKHNNSGKKSEPTSKRTKSRGPVQRDTKEVLAELVGKLKEKLDPKKVAATSAGEKHQRGELRPNLDRLTVGVDLGIRGLKSRATWAGTSPSLHAFSKSHPLIGVTFSTPTLHITHRH